MFKDTKSQEVLTCGLIFSWAQSFCLTLQDHGMQLMYSLMWPWQKVPGAKRLYYESALHKALELKNENGPKVSGNAEVIDNWPKRFQSKLLRELAED